MAKNLVIKKPDNILVAVPSGVKSGDPVAVGGITGVALTDSVDGTATIRRKGVFALEVEGTHMILDTIWKYDDVAVGVGDKLYYDANAGVKINKNDHEGVFFGYALGVVNAGETNTIQVLLK